MKRFFTRTLIGALLPLQLFAADTGGTPAADLATGASTPEKSTESLNKLIQEQIDRIHTKDKDEETSSIADQIVDPKKAMDPTYQQLVPTPPATTAAASEAPVESRGAPTLGQLARSTASVSGSGTSDGQALNGYGFGAGLENKKNTRSGR